MQGTAIRRAKTVNPQGILIDADVSDRGTSDRNQLDVAHAGRSRFFMGYETGYWKGRCGNCEAPASDAKTLDEEQDEYSWRCEKCEFTNHFLNPLWESVPKAIYCGNDLDKIFRLLPTPIGQRKSWVFKPYSVRSFVAQICCNVAECEYECSLGGFIHGQPVLEDICRNQYRSKAECELFSGSRLLTCPTWRRIRDLCHVGYEMDFLARYLRYAKGPCFPMLVPQPRLSRTEERRPDFALYVPVHAWRFEKIAVELDLNHEECREREDRKRNADLRDLGYEPYIIPPLPTKITNSPANKKHEENALSEYLEEQVKFLVKVVEDKMALCETAPIYTRIEVTRSVHPAMYDLPF